jgi:hypothetical protein
LQGGDAEERTLPVAKAPQDSAEQRAERLAHDMHALNADPVKVSAARM